MLRFLGAIIDLIVRLLPTPKEVRDKEAKKRREENRDRIKNVFGAGGSNPWWLR